MGGIEAAIITIGIGGLDVCRALSQRNDDRQIALRAWDNDRDGFVMGEGVGMLVIFLFILTALLPSYALLWY